MSTDITEEKVSECFIGPRKVEKIVPTDVKTYEGTQVMKIHYAGGFTQLLTLKTFNIVKTSEPKDYNYIRDVKFAQVTKEMYPLVGEHFLSYGKELTEEEKGDSRKDIIKRMISVICEYDVSVGEIQTFINTMIGDSNALFSALGFQVDNAYDRASNFLWNKDDTMFIPGYDQSNDLTLAMAKMVLDGIPAPAEEKKDGIETTEKAAE